MAANRDLAVAALPHNRSMPLSCEGRGPVTTERAGRLLRAVAAGVGLLTLMGCADTRYYWQAVGGQLQLMQASRPVAQWLDDSSTPESLKERLQLARRIRDFAVSDLALPDNPSYRRYADLGRAAVVWNVVAAPELSLTLKTWCFPVLGCVSYRGYFDESAARGVAALLKAQGMEVSVYGVPAYSTLGWMNWAGGDPLLNTFIGYPEGELARLIFHELAHQVLYARDDTTFNESFATAVERLGGERWLSRTGSQAQRAQFAQVDARKRQFRAVVLATRKELQEVYAQQAGPADIAALRARKAAVMQAFRDRHAQLKRGWDGYAGYDDWVANANNASLGAQAAYDELVPQFEAMFARQGHDWKAFYDAVRRIAELPAAERRSALAVTANK